MNDQNQTMAEAVSVANPYNPLKKMLTALFLVIFLLFISSVYLGFSGDLDKKHILSLVLSFLTLIILVIMLMVIVEEFVGIRTNDFKELERMFLLTNKTISSKLDFLIKK